MKEKTMNALAILLVACSVVMLVLLSFSLTKADLGCTVSEILNISAGGGDALSIKDGGDLRIYTPGDTSSASLFVDNDGELATSGDFKVNGDLKVIGTIVFTPQTSPPDNPERGEIYFDDGINTFMFWDGGNWKYVDSGYMGGLIDYIEATHTRKQCVDAGGVITSISGDGTNTEVCKFSGADVSCSGDWVQATNWQKYDPFEWGGDECERNKSTGPSSFSNQQPTRYWKGDAFTGDYSCTCEATGDGWAKWKFWGGSCMAYTPNYRIQTYNIITNTDNVSSNRVEIGCK